MKALIVEDDEKKLENAMRILEKKSVEYMHIDNYRDACTILKERDGINLIILDLCFYTNRAQKNILDINAGYNVLIAMSMYEQKIPVIIYSSEEDWDGSLQSLLFTTNFPGCTIDSDVSYLSENRRECFNRYRKIVIFARDLVIGHAHDEYELADLVEKFIKSV